MRRSLLFLVLLTVSADSPGLACAEDAYPSQPIKLTVPFGAGGGTDTFARVMKKVIDEHDLLPQPLVVINRGGAGATIGSRHVKDAPPDGYSMLILHDAIISAQLVNTVDYGPDAFEPIAGTGEVGMVITVAEGSLYQDLADLLEDASGRPNQVAFAANSGALTHFAAMEMEQKHPGARFRIVPSGGGADRFHDLQGGHVQVTGFSIEEFVRFREAGLRGLAYFGPQRSSAALDVPTARELGYDIVSTNIFYWWFPKGTPPERVKYMADMLRRAMETPAMQQHLAAIHCEPTYLSGQALQERIADTSRNMEQVKLHQTRGLPQLAHATGAAVILLGLLALGELLLLRRKPKSLASAQPEEAAGTHGLRPRLAAVTVGLTIVYVASMTWLEVGFRPATAVFVLACGGCLTGFRRRELSIFAALAVILSVGIYALFTRVLVIDLP